MPTSMSKMQFPNVEDADRLRREIIVRKQLRTFENVFVHVQIIERYGI
jgi:hypothetical protein